MASPTPERRDAASLDGRRFPVAQFWTYALWALVVCAYAYILTHALRHEGMDFHDVYLGPKSMLEGVSPYPTSSHPPPGPYVFPPGAPILLSPLSLFSRHAAWYLFAALSVLLLPAALAWIVRRERRSLPWLAPLVLLAVALFLPYRTALELGNVDLLCAGVILASLALLLPSSRSSTAILGAILVGAAVAIKPTLWPIALVVLVVIPMAPRIGLIAGAMVPTAIGLLVVPGVGRFFTYVLPFLGHGEQQVNTEREALGDLVRSAGVSSTATTDILLVLTAAATIGLLLVCARRAGGERGVMRFAALGPVVPLALALAPYGFLPYAVYLLVALPFALVGSRRWMALAAGVGIFAMGASVTLRYSGALNGLLQWRFLVGLVVLFAVTAAGLRERLHGRSVLGIGAH